MKALGKTLVQELFRKELKKMRVGDLIRRFSSFDPNLRVLFAEDDNRFAGDMTLDTAYADGDELTTRRDSNSEKILVVWLEFD